MFSKSLLYDLSFVHPQEPVVDQDCMETVSDGLLHQFGGHCGVHAATHRTNDLTFGSDHCTNPLDFLVDERLHTPVLSCLAYLNCEVANDFLASWSMGDLGMELNAKVRLGHSRGACVGGIFCAFKWLLR